LIDNCGDGQEHGIVNGMTVLAPDCAADLNQPGRHFWIESAQTIQIWKLSVLKNTWHYVRLIKMAVMTADLPCSERQCTRVPVVLLHPGCQRAIQTAASIV